MAGKSSTLKLVGSSHTQASEEHSESESTPDQVEQAHTNNADWAISVRSVAKKFEIFTHDRNRIYEFLGQRAHHSDHWAIQDLSFEIPRGSCFGVVGSNGAGKSTLLKLLSGISLPSSGELHIRGELSTLLDLGLGFHDGFSGRENIRLNCKLLGLSDEDIRSATPNIINFAELGDFIDFPVRTYSAGMHLRLGFAIAAYAPADILLIDEVLTVGDQRFQRKCVRKIEEFIAAGKTIVLVSHDLHAIRSLCTTVLWLENGRCRAIGPTKQVIDNYIDQGRTASSPIQGPSLGATSRPSVLPSTPQISTCTDPEINEAVLKASWIEQPEQLFSPGTTEAMDIVSGEDAVVQGSGEVRILKVQILDSNGHPRSRFQTNEDVVVAVTVRTTEPVPRPIFGIALFRSDGLYIHGPNTRFDDVLDGTYHGVYTFYIRWKQLSLLSGTYRLSIAVFDQHHLKPHIWHNQLYDLEFHSPIEDHGLMLLDHDWGMICHYEAPEGTVADKSIPESSEDRS